MLVIDLLSELACLPGYVVDFLLALLKNAIGFLQLLDQNTDIVPSILLLFLRLDQLGPQERYLLVHQLLYLKLLLSKLRLESLDFALVRYVILYNVLLGWVV